MPVAIIYYRSGDIWAWNFVAETAIVRPMHLSTLDCFHIRKTLNEAIDVVRREKARGMK